MEDDHEFIALELSVQNIDDTNESDEELDDISAITDFKDKYGEDRERCGSTYQSLSQRHQAAAPPVSLKNILEDERSFMLFRRFVKDGCISRNLQFWLACEHFRCQTFDRLKITESATAIYKKFLGSQAPLHVSVFDGTKKKIHLSIQLKNELNNNLFVQAQREVYHQMECNELRQFLISDSFSDCSMFNDDTNSAIFNGLESFEPAKWGGGSLHSGGSDDSTSVTSFNSDSISGTVLCVPHHTRHLVQSPRNAHSDTEHYSCNNSRRMGRTSHTTFFSRGKSLTSREFSELLYERLSAVEKDRANLQQRARNIARESGKSYEDIMSLKWFDAPEAVKYIQFEEGNGSSLPGNLKSGDVQATPPTTGVLPQQQGDVGTSHIVNFSTKEMQEALKDMEITRQVRQSKRTASVMSTSSASSYISDSGVGESYLPSSGGGSGPQPRSPWVTQYVQNQHRVTSQLSDRDHMAQLAATMLINNSTHQEDLNPNGRRGHYRNYPGAYSSDDSSSCFTTTSLSSNSEFFIPRRPAHMYTDSDDSRHHSRYPPGMKRVSHKRSSHGSAHQTPRYLSHPSPHQQPMPHPSSNTQLAPPPQQQSFPTPTNNIPSTIPTAPPTATPTPKAGDTILVAYTVEGHSNMLAKRLPSSQLCTLKDFKEKVFQRKGIYRFFFKTFCEDLNQELMEELSDDASPLPHFQGKIIGQVERAESDVS